MGPAVSNHRRHGVNVQIIADAAGRLVQATAALPGSTHDLTAARTHGTSALASKDVMTFAHKDYRDARSRVRAPSRDTAFGGSCHVRRGPSNGPTRSIRACSELAIATLTT